MANYLLLLLYVGTRLSRDRFVHWFLRHREQCRRSVSHLRQTLRLQPWYVSSACHPWNALSFLFFCVAVVVSAFFSSSFYATRCMDCMDCIALIVFPVIELRSHVCNCLLRHALRRALKRSFLVTRCLDYATGLVADPILLLPCSVFRLFL